MKVVSRWIPKDKEKQDNTLISLLVQESRRAANQSWRNFASDPDRRKVAGASNAGGQILENIEREYMTAMDFSPMQ